MDDATTVLGLPRIGAAALPDGVRELRVANDYTMFSGTAAPVLRLLQEPGRPVIGQVVFVWREYVPWQKQFRATKCTPWTDSTRTCAFVSPVTLDWTSVAARFDALGAWSIGEGCETTSRTMPDGKIVMTTSHITDSGDLYIGRTVGRVSSAYTCNAPRSRTGTSEGRAALSIYDYFLEVMKKSGGPPAA